MSNINNDKYSNLSIKQKELMEKLLKGKMKPTNKIESCQAEQKVLSFAQERLWFIEQIAKGLSTYNMAFTIVIKGDLNVDALKYSINCMLTRHETLRSRFINTEGSASLIIEETPEVNFEVVDITKNIELNKDQLISSHISAEAKKPFGVDELPLIRFKLIAKEKDIYVLIITMHHIISDGWSMGIMASEIIQNYSNWVDGKEDRNSKFEIVYSDYAQWQKKQFENGHYKEGIEFWKERLKEEIPVLQFPLDKRRPKTYSYKGKRAYFELEESLTNQIKAFAKKHNVTTFMVLYTTYSLLLHKFTNQDEVIVGTPFANRNYKEIENLIGFFVNMLPIRQKFDENCTIHDFLMRIKQEISQVFNYGEVPLEQLFKELNIERTLEYTPLFQTMFVYQNTPLPKIEINNILFEYVDVDNGTSKCDILLNAHEENNIIKGFFEYNTEIFEHETIKNLVNYYKLLMTIVLNSEDKKIGEIVLSLESDRKYLLESINSYEVKESLCDHIKNISLKYGNRIAINDKQQKITYSELESKSTILAKHLIQNGIKKGDIVCLLLEKSISAIISMLAIIKAGACYLPVDSNYPKDRVKFMVEDSNCPFAILSDIKKDDFSDIHVNRFYFNSLEDIDDIQVDQSLVLPSVDPEDIAYIIYTSGSTGKPKGCMVTHKNVMRLFHCTEDWFKFGPEDVWTLFHSIAFDFSVWEIYGALFYGGRLVIVDYLTARTTEDFRSLLIEEGVTVLNQTPSAFRQLIEVENNCIDTKIETLKYIVFGGEQLDFNMLKDWADKYGDKQPKLINMYGITETTVHVTYQEVTKADIANAYGSMVGIPIKDLKVFIMDKNLNPVPSGAVGEMYVAGDGVSNGYLNRPDLSKERFMDIDVFGTKVYVYKTGDLARFTQNYMIEYMGRADHQVKIRGFRIELGEIEEAIKRYGNINYAKVIPHKFSEDDVRLIAYMEINSDISLPIQLEEDNNISDENTLDEWEMVFDSYYSDDGAAKADESLNIIGWNSSYTQKQIENEEMLKWVEATVCRIKKYMGKKVLEVGSGTGMLLQRLHRDCEKYVGFDISQKAIEYNEMCLKRLNINNVELYCAPAHMVDQVVKEKFDTIILNSVIQYFPSWQYFLDTLNKLIDMTNIGGKIFLGDLRNLNIWDEFYYSTNNYKMNSEMRVAEFKNRVYNEKLLDKEILIDPEYFTYLKHTNDRITNVMVMIREECSITEMSKFRYDVVIEVEGKENIFEGKVVATTKADLKNNMQSYLEQDLVVFEGIENPRLANERKIIDSVSRASFVDIYTKCGQDEDRSFFSDVKQKARELDYDVVFTYNHADKYKIDVLCAKAGLERNIYSFEGAEDIAVKNIADYFSDPLKAKYIEQLKVSLRNNLTKDLPAYMLPYQFEIVEKIPLNINGKVDVKSLPIISLDRAFANTYSREAMTSTEREIADIFKELLGAGNIGPSHNFFELGGHSLLATKLVFKLKKKFNLNIPLKLIFENPTVKAIAQSIEQIDNNKNEEVIDITEDLLLPEGLDFTQTNEMHETNNVLLTGATGFLGAFLLKSLLEKTTANIYCLVRDDETQGISKKLLQSLKTYNIDTEPYKNRIFTINGDLSKKNLGISRDIYNELATKIDSVYHNGALVNFVYPYSFMKSANVDGTKEVIKFALEGRPKILNYVSTLYVFSKNDLKFTDQFHEYSVPQSFDGLNMGYTKSKFVSEKLVIKAIDEGLKGKVFRLARISGSTDDGACNNSDFLWRMVKACLLTNKYPNIDLNIDILPVNFVSDAIVQISEEIENEIVFHFFNERPFGMHRLIDILKSYGYNLKSAEFDKWKENLSASIEYIKDEDIVSLLPLVDSLAVDDSTNVFRMDITNKAFAEVGLTIPEISDELLRKYVEFFINNNFF